MTIHVLGFILRIVFVFQLGGPAPSGNSLGGLGDIFGMPTAQSYVPPQEVSFCCKNKYLYICLPFLYHVMNKFMYLCLN